MNARRLGLALAWLVLLLHTTSCVQVTWNHERRYSPVLPAALGRLEPGRTGLEQCLAELGAPLWVWENAENGRTSQVLAYGAFDERNLGLRVSVPVYRGLAASYDYDKIDERLHGVVLFFDANWTLTAWREGLLRDLTQQLRRPRPSYEPDDEASAPAKGP